MEYIEEFLLQYILRKAAKQLNLIIPAMRMRTGNCEERSLCLKQLYL